MYICYVTCSIPCHHETTGLRSSLTPVSPSKNTSIFACTSLARFTIGWVLITIDNSVKYIKHRYSQKLTEG